MASVLSSVIDAIKSLLEGSSGTNNIIASNTFRWLPDQDSFTAAHCGRNPRPFTIEVKEDAPVDGYPPFLAGSYNYQGKRIDVQVFYADTPFDALTLEKTIADNRVTILNCLLDPINFSATNGWCNVDINTLRAYY